MDLRSSPLAVDVHEPDTVLSLCYYMFSDTQRRGIALTSTLIDEDVEGQWVKKCVQGFPSGSVVTKSTYQCRRLGFDP